MKINNIHIRNFRNYKDLKLNFNNKKNIFIGNNAQGKTNLLESIYVLAITKSHRMNIDNTLIKDNELFTKIQGTVIKNNEKLNLEVLINEKGKCVKINNNVMKKISNYISNFTVIIFYPDDLEIVKGSPSVRRKFLNIEIGQLNNKYLNNLNDYNLLLKNRNEYLKDVKIDNINKEYIDIINNQLVDKAICIYKDRNEFINNINDNATNIFRDIFGSSKLSIIYKPNIEIMNFNDEEIRRVFLDKLNSSLKRDILQGTTNFGPHRDDFEFLIDNNDIREYGSQGQQRLATLCLKLAELPIFKEKTGEYPVLLLDDIFSELDEEKRNNIIKYVDGDIQTFITTTDINSIDEKIMKDATIYKISNGEILI